MRSGRWIPTYENLPEILQKILLRVLFEAREHLGQFLISKVVIHGLAEYLPEVRRDRQIAALVEVLLLKSGPASVNLAAFDGTTQDEHDVGVSVVGTAVAVFARGAAEF